jgi:glutathione S-transferase
VSSPTIKLHWSPRSPFVRKVMVVLHETGLVGSVELMRNPVAMDRPNTRVLADNPLGKIPTLVLADGSALFDSRVICEFLDGLHDGPRLFPARQPERSRALVRQALADGLLDIVVLWRNWHTERGRDPFDPSDAVQAGFAVKVEATLNRLEEATPEIGSMPDIGDIAVACALSYLDFRWGVLSWRNRRERLAAWHDAFASRPSMMATHIVDDQPATQGQP